MSKPAQEEALIKLKETFTTPLRSVEQLTQAVATPIKGERRFHLDGLAQAGTDLSEAFEVLYQVIEENPAVAQEWFTRYRQQQSNTSGN